MGGAANHPSSEKDPKAISPTISEFSTDEKPSSTHTQTQIPTPTLDAFLQRPTIAPKMTDLTTALHGFDQNNWKESAQPIVQGLGALVYEVKGEKKAGRVSREEKKAMKGELKGLGREVGRRVKGLKGGAKAAA